MLMFADGAALGFVFIEASVFVLLLLFILPPTVFAFAELKPGFVCCHDHCHQLLSVIKDA